MGPDLTCRELVELVTDYLEGALAEREHERFAAHMTECDGCTAYVEQIRSIIRLAGHAQSLEARPEIAALLETFRDYRRTV